MAKAEHIPVLVLKALVFIVVVVTVNGEENNRDIELRPAAELQEAEISQGDFICRFYYKVQGGTYEKWIMNLVGSEDGKEYTCTISRPTHSYLFFQEFKVKIIGGMPEFAEGVNQDEYILDKKNMEVRHNPSMFKNHLSKIIVYASARHNEEL